MLNQSTWRYSDMCLSTETLLFHIKSSNKSSIVHLTALRLHSYRYLPLVLIEQIYFVEFIKLALFENTHLFHGVDAPSLYNS